MRIHQNFDQCSVFWERMSYRTQAPTDTAKYCKSKILNLPNLLLKYRWFVIFFFRSPDIRPYSQQNRALKQFNSICFNGTEFGGNIFVLNFFDPLFSTTLSFPCLYCFGCYRRREVNAIQKKIPRVLLNIRTWLIEYLYAAAATIITTTAAILSTSPSRLLQLR